MTAMEPTISVLHKVLQERITQEARYGDTNDLVRSGTGPQTAWLLPYTSDGAAKIQREVRADYEDWEEDSGLPTWVHLVREEIAEAFEIPDDDPRLIDELIQVAALCVSWVERLEAKAEAEAEEYPDNRCGVCGSFEHFVKDHPAEEAKA